MPMPTVGGRIIASAPETQMIEWVRQAATSSFDAYERLRRESVEAAEFLKGRSWDEDTLKELEEKKLPALHLNIMLPVFLRIWGAESASRGKMRATILKGGTKLIADTFNELIEWAEGNFSIYEEFARAFQQSTLTNLPGWVEVLWSHKKDPLGHPQVMWRNNNHIFSDPDSERLDLSDARYVFKSWYMSKADIVQWAEHAFPDKVPQIINDLPERKNEWIQKMSDGWQQLWGTSKGTQVDWIEQKSGKWRMFEFQIREPYTQHMVYHDESKNFIGIDSKDIMKVDKPVVKKTGDAIRIMTTVADRLTLQYTDAIVQNGMFSLIPCWGLNFDGENMGIGPQLVDPQREYNKARSSELAILSSTANSGWITVKGSLDDDQKQKLEAHGAATGLHLETNPGFTPPQKIEPNMPPTGMLGRSAQAKADVDAISSMHANARGTVETTNESGILFDSRVEQSLQTLEPFFRNYELCLRMGGTYMLEMMQKKMKYPRTLEVTGEDGDPRIFSINQFPWDNIKQGRYGIRIEKAAFAGTERQRMLAQFVTILQNMPPELVPWHKIMTLQEWPEKERQEVEQFILERMPQPPQQQLGAGQVQEVINQTFQ